MATPEELEAEIAATKALLAAGAKSVSHDGKSVQYYDPADLRQRLSELTRQLAVANGEDSKTLTYLDLSG